MKKTKNVIKLILVSTLVFSFAFTSIAADTEEEQKTIQENQQRKQEAQETIEKLNQQKSDIEEYVRQLDIELEDVQKNMQEIKVQIADLEESIAITQKELDVAKDNEAKQYELMKKRIKMMYENGGVEYVSAMLKSSSISNMLNRSEYITQIAEYDNNMYDELQSIREDIAIKEQKLENDHEIASALEVELQDNEDALEILINGKNEEISNYSASIDATSEQIQKYNEAIAEQENIIAQKEEAERQAALAAGGSEQTVYTGGQLLWPCPSSSRITSYFGLRDSDGGYVTAVHNGIDIGAVTGTPVVAVADGTVVIARPSDSAGNWVTINHGGGLFTVYMHASQLLVSEGQKVKAGDTILLVGSTGWSTGPHLHFGVRINGTYVNPLLYVGG